ncbi:MAG: histidine phosphatase family protein [Alphaproteobacteria bacterium]|nr:histidine phosphatase family protein [Alphaproteobacteria bacterium]
MKRNFYFFRHGQRNGVDEISTLNKIGLAQAEKLKEFLSDKNIEIIYSSPLKRAIDSAKIAVNNPDIKIIADDRLIESAFGFWYSNNDERQKRITENFNRIKSCFDDILINDTHSNIAIASHGGVTRALCWACGQEIGEIKHCECFHFTLDNGNWKLIERFDTKIEGPNENQEACKTSQIYD